MKKSILSASIAAMIGGLGFAGLANAAIGVYSDAADPNAPVAAGNAANATAATTLAINEAGIGNILVVPYFTTQGTNATLLNITNTDASNGKVVKVRFRGASNSDDIFDFTLMLSPGDVWAAKVSQGADGRSQLETADKTCTLPSIVATQKNSFPTGRLNSSLTDAQKANETREGYIEILNMADVPKAVQTNQAVASGVTTNPLYTAIKHVNGVAPCTASALAPLLSAATDYVAGATDTTATTIQGKGMKFPTGKLMANWTIIDTVKTATFSGAATAVAAGSGTAINANVVFFPQSDAAAGNVDAWSADPLFQTTSTNISRINPATGSSASGSGTPFIAASYYDLPDLSTPYLALTTATNTPFAHAETLTARLAAKSVINEYLTTTSIGATTDWVFSSPTRRYNVAMNYAYASPLGGDGRVYSLWTNNYFDSTNTSVSGGKICVKADTGAAGVNQWDREETTTSSQFVISPGTVTNVVFCGETSVLAINNGTNTSSGSLSASLALQNLNVTSNEGWISLGTSGLSNRGLPVLGGAFAKSSAFGAMWPHRYTR
ncbi:cell surface protein [Paracidovorax sp. MALMAid1276]|uniref:cell surface protein n=1 Tax=Paracidovorax sp. MALMAid1276 TaxID=3411631 RepID=UPI003B9B726B